MSLNLKITAALMALAFPLEAVAGSAPSDLCGDCIAVKVASCGGFLEGAEHGPDGTLWLVDVTGDRLLSIAGGKCIEKAKTGGHPNGAKFTPDGKILIADWTGLLEFDMKSGKLSPLNLTYDGKALTGLNDLAFDRQGGLYFTAPGRSSALQPDGRIFYRPVAGSVQLVGDRFAYPNGLAVSADGETLLVADFANKRILSIPAVGAKGPIKLAYVFANTEGGVGPDGMRMDDQGRLFAANLGAKEILVFDAHAHLLGRIGLPKEARSLVTNLSIYRGVLYVTEAEKGEVWKVDLKAAAKH